MLWHSVQGAGGLVGGGGPIAPTYLGYCGDNAVSTSGSGNYTESGATLGTPDSNRVIVVAIAGSNGHEAESITVAGVSATLVAGPSSSTANFGQIWAASVPTGAAGDIVVTAGSGDVSYGFVWYAIYPSGGITPTATVDNDTSRSSTNINSYGSGVIICSISTRSDSTMDFPTWSGTSTIESPLRAVVSNSSARYGFIFMMPVGSSDTNTPGTFSFSGINDTGNKAIASWEP